MRKNFNPVNILTWRVPPPLGFLDHKGEFHYIDDLRGAWGP